MHIRYVLESNENSQNGGPSYFPEQRHSKDAYAIKGGGGVEASLQCWLHWCLYKMVLKYLQINTPTKHVFWVTHFIGRRSLRSLLDLFQSKETIAHSREDLCVANSCNKLHPAGESSGKQGVAGSCILLFVFTKESGHSFSVDYVPQGRAYIFIFSRTSQGLRTGMK